MLHMSQHALWSIFILNPRLVCWQNDKMWFLIFPQLCNIMSQILWVKSVRFHHLKSSSWVFQTSSCNIQLLHRFHSHGCVHQLQVKRLVLSCCCVLLFSITTIQNGLRYPRHNSSFRPFQDGCGEATGNEDRDGGWHETKVTGQIHLHQQTHGGRQ